MKAVPLLALLLLALGAPSALAAASIDKGTVTAGTEVVLTVDAPVEQLGATNERLTVDMPDGFRVLSCEAPEGFKCSHGPAPGAKRTVVTWQRVAPGQPVAFTADQFPFRMRAIDKPGKYTFGVTQFHADGSVAEAEHLLRVNPHTEPALVITRTPSTVPAAVRIQSATPTTRPELARTMVTEPEWLRESGPVPAAEIAVQELDAETSRTPLMVLLGVVVAMAALGVFWFRRRVLDES